MRLTYTLTEDAGSYLAECVESDAAGEGTTPEAAVDSLRKSLEERMFRPDAVAPPSVAPREKIELVKSDERSARKSLDLGGPGDAPPR